MTRLPILTKNVRNFVKKNKQTLILDLNMDDDVKKLKEIGNIAQIKLEDNGVGDILDLHSQVLNSGYPDYIGCRINFQFFRDNLTDYDDKLICDLLE
jgi:hypothetical protein